MPTKKWYPTGATFGIDAPADKHSLGFVESGNPFVPKTEDYIFRKDILRDVLAFLEHPFGDALFLIGPTGSGKTSILTQTAARLHYPVQRLTCTGNTEFSDLVGQFMMASGTMTFVHGPLARAMKEGHILLLNEVDLMGPSELAGLNDIIEGQPLLIPQNGGEMILPHKQFRIVFTGNSTGQGDQAGLYRGVQQQNLAFMDRCRLAYVGYSEPALEKMVLQKVAKAMGYEFDAAVEGIVDNMISVANDIRRQFVGDDETAGTLTVTMSTRTLRRWLSQSLAFKGHDTPIEYALERALTFRTDPIQKMAIHRIVKDTFGFY
jgi:cobaltochelatase CobS